MDGEVAKVEGAPRRKVVWCAASSLIWFMDPSSPVVCVEGVPQGAKVVAATYDITRDAFGVVIEHESFDPVPPRTAYPEFWPLFRKKDD